MKADATLTKRSKMFNAVKIFAVEASWFLLVLPDLTILTKYDKDKVLAAVPNIAMSRLNTATAMRKSGLVVVAADSVDIVTLVLYQRLGWSNKVKLTLITANCSC